ncbi:MAG: T9SS C-terminal target domain-containing protein [Bacteroidetes bacterium]|nr:MAG: T9SS C-terminal target domain-containing protein [Bacteroidota bacterium]
MVNNTIIYNYSTGPGGGIRAWGTSMTVKNNILWGNTANTGKQIFSSGGTITVLYNDVQDSYAGAGNFNADPEFDALNYYLSVISPCIDKGDSTADYNDLADPLNPTSAKFPSKGGLRNDMGVYGGPYSSLISSLSTIWTSAGPPANTGPSPEILIMPNPVRDVAVIAIQAGNIHSLNSELYDMNSRVVRHMSLNASASGECRIRFSRGSLSSGNYLLVLTADDHIVAKKPLIID